MIKELLGSATCIQKKVSTSIFSSPTTTSQNDVNDLGQACGLKDSCLISVEYQGMSIYSSSHSMHIYHDELSCRPYHTQNVVIYLSFQTDFLIDVNIYTSTISPRGRRF